MSSPPPRRRSSTGKKSSSGSPSRKKSSKSRPSKSSNGPPVGLLIGVFVVLAVVIGGGIWIANNRGGNGGDTTQASNNANGSSLNDDYVSTASESEQQLYEEFNEYMRSEFPPRDLDTNARREWIQNRIKAFADSHNISVEELNKRTRAAAKDRVAKNRVTTNWEPLKVKVPDQEWPNAVDIDISNVQYSVSLTEPLLPGPVIFASGSSNSQAQRVIDLLNPANSTEVEWEQKPYKIAISHDGTLAAIVPRAEQKDRIDIVETKNSQVKQTLTGLGIQRIRVFGFLDANRLFVIGPSENGDQRTRNSRLSVFDLTSGNAIVSKEDEYPIVQEKMAFSPDGNFLACIPRGPGVVVYDLSSGNIHSKLGLDDERIENSSINTLAFSQDGTTIAVMNEKVYDTSRLFLIDTSNGEIRKSIDFPGSKSTFGGSLETGGKSLSWFPDNRHLLIYGLFVLDTETGHRVCHLEGRQSGVNSLRQPINEGVMYQQNEKLMSFRLKSVSVPFSQFDSVIRDLPNSATSVLKPGMTVRVQVDLEAVGLAGKASTLQQAMEERLNDKGFLIGENAECVLHLNYNAAAKSLVETRKSKFEGSTFLTLLWTNADGSEVFWQKEVVDDSSVVVHLQDIGSGRSRNESVTRMKFYPIPYYISEDRSVVLPMIHKIEHDIR